MSLIGSLLRSFFEGRASKTSTDQIRDGLVTGGDQVAGRISGAADTPANRKQAGHVIGIERWGANRLRSALTPGTPSQKDEYDSYRPHGDQSMTSLAAEFKTTRAEIIALLESLRSVEDCRIPHNDFGPLSVRGWLVYLTDHASRESKGLK